MKFNTFLRLHLVCGEDYINTMSKFKREDPEHYNRYRERVQKVEDFYRQDQQRNTKTFNRPLTVEDFPKWEKAFNAMAKLKGVEPTNMSED
ncbi:hypothetical protein SAMN04487770_1637 [Butyrivibrio sp. ob235]|uniref:hypothetical protein n=1 Tax=Butyrivibrio sp. ob235 TaxID=1761780 RepID=UPI0008B783EC|nr:hypothetical protein [Butyrivibrio sp. ob235]SEM67584.1 hypothetical protein SAMN04487770_1637 [Butyrivibrio sp. ob235]